MAEITYQMVLSTLQTISIMVGIIYYLGILRNTQKTRELTLKAQEQVLETRKLQLFIQQYQKVTSVEFQKISNELLEWEWDSFDDFSEKYVSDPKVFAEWVIYMLNHDSRGILVKAGLIDLERVYDLMYDIIVWHWDKYGDINIKHREVFDNPDFMAGYEYLVYELKKMRVEKGFSADRPEILGRYVSQNRPDA